MNLEQLRKLNEFSELLQAMRSTIVHGTEPNMKASKNALANTEAWLDANPEFMDSYVQILGEAGPLIPELVQVTDDYLAVIQKINKAAPELLGLPLDEEQPE